MLPVWKICCSKCNLCEIERNLRNVSREPTKISSLKNLQSKRDFVWIFVLLKLSPCESTWSGSWGRLRSANPRLEFLHRTRSKSKLAKGRRSATSTQIGVLRNCYLMRSIRRVFIMEQEVGYWISDHFNEVGCGDRSVAISLFAQMSRSTKSYLSVTSITSCRQSTWFTRHLDLYDRNSIYDGFREESVPGGRSRVHHTPRTLIVHETYEIDT